MTVEWSPKAGIENVVCKGTGQFSDISYIDLLITTIYMTGLG